MKTPTTGSLAVLGACALLAAGCGKSSKTTSTSNAAASTPASTQSSSTTAAATAGESVTTKHSGKLGTILAAGPKHLTVYLFEADKSDASNCSGTCAAAWPPVTTEGNPTPSGAVKSSELGTIKRSDGTTQVTYNGHPLYFFERDKDSGDAYGQGVDGFGAEWYVLSPSGKKVDDDDDSDKGSDDS